MRNKQLITFLYSGCETNPEWDCIFIEKDCSYPRTTPYGVVYNRLFYRSINIWILRILSTK